MAGSTGDEEIGQAVLQNVESGVYQPSAELAEVQLPPTAVPVLLDGIEKARDRVKDEIRTLSKQAAPDIEGWISRAKQIQQDIERSKATAHDIVAQAEEVKKHKTRVDDTASKVALLEKELIFNETLAQTIGQIQGISETLRHVQDAVVHNNLVRAIDQLTEASEAIGYLSTYENTRIVGVLRKKADQLKASILGAVNEFWNAIFYVEASEKRITVKGQAQKESYSVDIATVVDAMKKLGTLDTAISRLARDFDNIIVAGRLRNDRDHSPMEIHINGDVISATGSIKDFGVREALLDMNSITEYLSTRLPKSIAIPMSSKLMPSLISRLTTDWLNPSLPLSLDALQEFQQTSVMVRNLADSLDSLGWDGKKELTLWVENVPYTWLQKQREAALFQVRSLCLKGIQSKHVVERVETQVVSGDDAILQQPSQEDDEGWGAEWDQDENENPEPSGNEPAKDEAQQEPKEDEDADAWGWNEEEATEDATPDAGGDVVKEEKAEDAEEDADAWGWGEEEEEKAAPAQTPVAAVSSSTKNAAPSASVNGAAPKGAPAQRELTLRETYTVTAIPDSLLGMVAQIISDMEKLTDATYSGLDVGTAAGQLSSIPSLILAMYRATAAATHYSNDVAGNMLVYNDCMRIADQLRATLEAQAKKDQQKPQQALRPSSLLYLENDIKAISAFGKRAYGAEMEAQRTIIRDLLDGAQGFAHCTVHPFSGECDNAIAMTVDRLREVHRNWKGILSHSALLQSMGSILAAVTGKMISDIEDMSDISEEESQRLRNFCLEIGKISDLFVSEDPSQPSGDLTGIYTPNWFKFQYLSEILDSSLADIKYLWTDGELRLEFEADEVIDLIKALFAESEHRRKAVSEIRRTANR